MLSLSIVAACIIGCNYAANCPSGTSQFGGSHPPISSCEVYSNITDIATCKTSCESACIFFGYSALQEQCATYQVARLGLEQVVPPQDQILCVISGQQCPSGFAQIGGGGPMGGGGGPMGRGPPQRGGFPMGGGGGPMGGGDQFGRTMGGGRGRRLQTPGDSITQGTTNKCGQEAADSIGECVDFCNENNCCQSFSYSDVTKTCAIYAGPRPLLGRPGPIQIVCAVTPDLSAKSPGLFSVDGMVGYSNGNGQVYVQIPAYVVYGIVALILVNIVCLMVHCWNKSKCNSKDYKTVSMRSDIDEETEIN